MTSPEMHEARLATLESRVAMLMGMNLQELAETQRDAARMMAIISILQEVLTHAGMSKEDFGKHFQARQDYFHARNLEMAKAAADPSPAAEGDARPGTRVETAGPYPPLFMAPPNTPQRSA